MTAFHSTRGGGPATLEAVLQTGTAPDGGLYVPERLAVFEREALAEAATPAELAEHMLAPYFAGSSLAGALPDICRNAFGFPLPLVDLSPAARRCDCWSCFTVPPRRSRTMARGSWRPAWSASLPKSPRPRRR